MATLKILLVCMYATEWSEMLLVHFWHPRTALSQKLKKDHCSPILECLFQIQAWQEIFTCCKKGLKGPTVHIHVHISAVHLCTSVFRDCCSQYIYTFKWISCAKSSTMIVIKTNSKTYQYVLSSVVKTEFSLFFSFYLGHNQIRKVHTYPLIKSRAM